MNSNFKRNLIISTGASIVILILSSITSYLSIKNLLESNNMVSHTHEVIYNLNAAKMTMTEAQTGVRGYLITGESRFLDSHRNSEVETREYLQRLQDLTIDNAAQQASLRQLKPLSYSFFRYLERRIKEKRDNRNVLTHDLSRGKELMDQIRVQLNTMEKREDVLLANRTETSARYGNYTSMLIIAAALIAVLISLFFLMRIIRDYRDRLKLQEELEIKDRETAERIKVIDSIASEVAAGNYNTRINDTQSDTLGSVAVSLNNMAQSLEESFTQLSEREWLQLGLAQLNNAMLGEKEIKELSTAVIEFLCVYTNSQAGVLYTSEEQHLQFSAGYSYDKSKIKEHLEIGEGMSGQAASSGKLLELRFPKDDSIKVTYALGEAKPRHIIALPLHDNGIMGVLEIATLDEYGSKELQLFEAAANNIGIAIRAANNRKRIQELLEETQSQSEELMAQHRELESMNAELETQTEKLQASEEELKVQQEELQQTNEELNERSVLLEEQNLEIQKKSEALELSTRYKSEFLANMSHELRTPLNSILLLSRLLGENNDKNLSKEQIEFANVIQSSGNGLLGLIDEILDLSKIEAGKMDLEIMEVPVADIAKGLDALFKEVAKAKHIT